MVTAMTKMWSSGTPFFFNSCEAWGVCSHKQVSQTEPRQSVAVALGSNRAALCTVNASSTDEPWPMIGSNSNTVLSFTLSGTVEDSMMRWPVYSP